MKLPKISILKKPTYVRIQENVDFFMLFKKIEKEFDTCFIYESLGEEGKFSRYSILGFDPAHSISARDNTVTFDGGTFHVENPYVALRDIMPNPTITRMYAGGLVGYLSYEALRYFEPTLHVKVHDAFDQFMFGVYLDGLIFDKLTNDLFYFFYDDDRSAMLRKIARNIEPEGEVSVKFMHDTRTEAEHASSVKEVKEHIQAGNTFQCEVGFKSKYTIEGDAIVIYERLREVNPSPFMYYIKFKDKKIIGASPELLFSLRDGEMTTQPLAGTARRGVSDAEDQKFARELLQDPKEHAEHTMLVDLHRNDIGRVAQFGTVHIRELMGIKKFSHVQHISSEIAGVIRAGEDMFSALASNFPAGTVSGAPKIESIKIIDSQENEARGPYGGGVGHFGFNGDCLFALTIRSVYIAGTDAYVQTSGGIVADSQIDKEYMEIQNKLAAMKKVLSI